MPNDPKSIEAQLKAQLDDAQKAWDEARANLRTVFAEVPSGIPNPDGIQRLISAGIKERAAGAAYVDALKRFTNFIVHGECPDGGPQPGEK